MFDSVFRAIDSQGNGRIEAQQIAATLETSGFPRTDPRLRAFYDKLEQTEPENDGSIDHTAFGELLRAGPTLFDRAIRGELVIPQFAEFSSQISQIFDATAANTSGEVASYIPQLARVSPERFGLAICTVDGQRLKLGDADEPFTFQSSCKPLLYALALEAHGVDHVHQHIGREPSGLLFNELTLNRNGRPHNPMINAGAIVSSSLFLSDRPMSDRHEGLTEVLDRLSGGVRPGFDSAVFHSERDNADRNFALAHHMREKGAFPHGTDIFRTLDLYFAACSMQTTTDSMATIAATFASGGICPPTGERVFAASTVKHCLSMMYSCGMYDYSGEFAFRVGLPAKSAVSGVILAVVPNVLGIAVWSPRLDVIGNSVRGVEFLERLVEAFSFHTYDNLVESTKIDPRRDRQAADSNATFNAIHAASRNDVDQLRRLVALGHSLDTADYDGRTPLHLSAVEGHAGAVEYLINQGVGLTPKDRWGNTPLDDATRQGWQCIVEMLSVAIKMIHARQDDERLDASA
jgi:glutaminase